MGDRRFELVSDFEPRGDQPRTIQELLEGLAGDASVSQQVLLGATGTGKTFTVANVIEELQTPTLVLAPNKTLAAQLYTEFKGFFPHNAVEYFVSYYDYYQPEAYIPATDTFIEKDALINEAIDRMRHSATRALLERRDVLIVASVSCIYGLGDRTTYAGMMVGLEVGGRVRRDRLLRQLVDIQYSRNDYDFHRGTFRVRGDVVEIFPTYEEDRAIRLEFWGDELEAITEVDPIRGTVQGHLETVEIYPASHYVTPQDALRRAVVSIQDELGERLPEMREQGQLLEAQRLEQRTLYDVEMLEQVGFCHGIENYSRHLTGRSPGEPPPVLLDYFPDDYLLVIDESHVAVPQIGAMFRGDRARKLNLVGHGFRLPSALDNRPLKFDEWEGKAARVVYMSATPGSYELERAQGVIIEQLIRPTGLVDPHVEVRPVGSQVDDLLEEIHRTVERGWRVLVTTLTKRMAEDLTEYYRELGIKVRYLHSDIDTLERVELLDDLRRGTFDVLVGINLLREGLDLPEVGLVAILDADKAGFLRAERSLIQTIGRAARNVEGRVLLYGDVMTDAMRAAIEETDRRRAIQEAHNEREGITPETVVRPLAPIEPPPEDPDRPRHPGSRPKSGRSKAAAQSGAAEGRARPTPRLDPEAAMGEAAKLRTEMTAAARELEFERAAELRDRIRELEELALGL